MNGVLRPARIAEFEGDRIRLHVERKVFGGRPGAEHGKSWLTLSANDDPDALDEVAFVVLPLWQSEALAQACAAFNHIMNEHERRAAVVLAAARPGRVAVRTPEINPR